MTTKASAKRQFNTWNWNRPLKSLKFQSFDHWSNLVSGGAGAEEFGQFHLR